MRILNKFRGHSWANGIANVCKPNPQSSELTDSPAVYRVPPIAQGSSGYRGGTRGRTPEWLYARRVDRVALFNELISASIRERVLSRMDNLTRGEMRFLLGRWRDSMILHLRVGHSCEGEVGLLLVGHFSRVNTLRSNVCNFILRMLKISNPWKSSLFHTAWVQNGGRRNREKTPPRERGETTPFRLTRGGGS